MSKDRSQKGEIHEKTQKKPLIEHGRPLISALNQFHTEKGYYPQKLEELTPHYLLSLLNTGAIGNPNFEYQVLGTEYELSFSRPSERFFNCLVYSPDKNYQNGNSFLRIGDWAYY